MKIELDPSPQQQQTKPKSHETEANNQYEPIGDISKFFF